MKRVDFYVLSDTAADARLRFACRLAEKAVDRGHRVYVQTSSPALTQHLDELMWTFSDRSFLAHEVANDAAPPPHPRVLVLLGQVEAPLSHRELLINLTDRLPDLDAYERIIEIVDVDPERKRLSRERFKIYRDRGCALRTHNL